VADALVFTPAAAGDEPVRFGVYRVLERIAQGGMGLIYRCEAVGGGPPVAIKTVRSPREVDAAAIRREIVTLAHLDHPGIVRLQAHGTRAGAPWLAMELLEGRTLREEMSWYWPETSGGDSERLQRTDERPTTPARGLQDRPRDPERPPFPVAGGGHLAETFSIVGQLCLALDHLHGRGLVHRDVKPANVFLRTDGRATLFDFGLACSAIAGASNDLCVGTMEYSAPEQVCGAAVDRRADIYSLGCLLYELVTGQLPVRGGSSSEIAERQVRFEPVAPSLLIADVPSQLEDLVMSMLAKAPAHRPDSAAEIGQRLTNIARRAQQTAGIALDDPPLSSRQAG
jgi:serine/threonine protein kinase